MPDPSPETFPARLARLRRRAGLSQSELARRCSLSRQQVRNYEAGASEPTLSRLAALAAAIGCKPADFFPS